MPGRRRPACLSPRRWQRRPAPSGCGRCGRTNWSVRLREIRERGAAGMLDPARWHPDHRDLSVEAALELLAEPPLVDELVVCHGDSCAPNTLITGNGCCSGHLDLGALGVADRWADLAIATWSTTWNYGPQ
jgi:aminoglycoside phosphotransferase